MLLRKVSLITNMPYLVRHVGDIADIVVNNFRQCKKGLSWEKGFITLTQGLKLEKLFHSTSGFLSPEQLHEWSVKLDLPGEVVVNWFADKWAERFEFEAETWRRKASQTRALAATGVNLKTTWSGHSTTSFKTMFMKSTSVLSPLTLNRTTDILQTSVIELTIN